MLTSADSLASKCRYILSITLVFSHSPDKVSIIFERCQSTRHFHSLAGSFRLCVSPLACLFSVWVRCFLFSGSQVLSLSGHPNLLSVLHCIFYIRLYFTHKCMIYSHFYVWDHIYMRLNIWNIEINKVIENAGLCYFNCYWVVLQDQTVAKSFEMCLNLQNCYILPQTLDTSTDVEQDRNHSLVYSL